MRATRSLLLLAVLVTAALAQRGPGGGGGGGGGGSSTVVATCPNGRSCPRATRPYCSTPTRITYASTQCATCNNDFGPFSPGECAAIPETIVSKCTAPTQDTCGAAYAKACGKLYAPVCANGVEYYNEACAYCSGAEPDDITKGMCPDPDGYDDTCPSGTPQQDQDACNGRNSLETPVCGSDGVTYRNLRCLVCQRFGGASLSVTNYGPCKRDYTPCDNISCPENAECSVDVADCDFETSTCAWLPQGNGWLRMNASAPMPPAHPIIDSTMGNVANGHFMLANPPPRPSTTQVLMCPTNNTCREAGRNLVCGADFNTYYNPECAACSGQQVLLSRPCPPVATMTSVEFDTAPNSEPCTFEFSFMIKGNASALSVAMALADDQTTGALLQLSPTATLR